MIRKWLTQWVTARNLPPNPYPGEMLPIERLRLYQWMTSYQPKVVLEVGTGVGGSTFYISSALHQYGGELHSCDPMRSPPEPFLQRFRGTLHYHALRSDQLIDQMRRDGKKPDFLFFDGPEIPELALSDLCSLEPWIEPGCWFAMHDWEQPGGRNRKIVSIKAKKVRPYLENSPNWRRIEQLEGHRKNVWWTKGRFDSVGLCLYEYRPTGSARSAVPFKQAS
jgi:predicted O-methyltransferase YrrM